MISGFPKEICDIVDDYYDENKYIFPWCLKLPLLHKKQKWLETLYKFIGDVLRNRRIKECKQIVITNVASKKTIKATLEPTYEIEIQYKRNDSAKWGLFDKRYICELLEQLCQSKYTIDFYCTKIHDRQLKIGNVHANIAYSSYYNLYDGNGFGNDKIAVVYELIS